MPASTSSWQRRSYSSAEPSHQWIASGWVRSAISSTQAISFAFFGQLLGGAVLSLKLGLNSFSRCGGNGRAGVTAWRILAPARCQRGRSLGLPAAPPPPMRFYEYESRRIVERAGIPVTDYGFATTAAEAREAAERDRRADGDQVPGAHRRPDEGGRGQVRRHPEEAERARGRDPRARDRRPHAGRRPRRPEGGGRAGVLRGGALGRTGEAPDDAVQRHGRDRHRAGRRASTPTTSAAAISPTCTRSPTSRPSRRSRAAGVTGSELNRANRSSPASPDCSATTT